MKPNTIAILLGRTVMDPETNCWLYTGTLTKGGYAIVSYQGKMQCLHRLIYENFVGPIPEGLQTDHVKEICPNRHCCNPFHIEPVTQQENLRRGKGTAPGTAAAAAKARAETHCRQGHEFTPENTHICTNGRRRCRTCVRLRDGLRYREYKLEPAYQKRRDDEEYKARHRAREKARYWEKKVNPSSKPHP